MSTSTARSMQNGRRSSVRTKRLMYGVTYFTHWGAQCPPGLHYICSDYWLEITSASSGNDAHAVYPAGSLMFLTNPPQNVKQVSAPSQMLCMLPMLQNVHFVWNRALQWSENFSQRTGLTSLPFKKLQQTFPRTLCWVGNWHTCLSKSVPVTWMTFPSEQRTSGKPVQEFVVPSLPWQ